MVLNLTARLVLKVNFSSMRLSGAWLCGLEPWLRALLVSRPLLSCLASPTLHGSGILCSVKPLLFPIAWLKNLLCYIIHYGTYRGAVVGLRGAVVGVRGAAVGVRGAAVGVRGAAVGVRGAAVGNIGIPLYVISRGAVVRHPRGINILEAGSIFSISGLVTSNTVQCQTMKFSKIPPHSGMKIPPHSGMDAKIFNFI